MPIAHPQFDYKTTRVEKNIYKGKKNWMRLISLNNSNSNNTNCLENHNFNFGFGRKYRFDRECARDDLCIRCVHALLYVCARPAKRNIVFRITMLYLIELIIVITWTIFFFTVSSSHSAFSAPPVELDRRVSLSRSLLFSFHIACCTIALFQVLQMMKNYNWTEHNS